MIRLIKCYIENFGKLSKFSYDFNSQLNIINQENGWGKSTFATFIKAMFYGLAANRRNKDLDKNEREKYLPWQGGNFGGNLEFATNGKQYRIERFFGKTSTDDTFKLYSSLTGKVTNDFSENIGEELFGLDAEGFQRTLFIPQKVLDSNINESISKRLTNLIQGTTEDFNYEAAQKILDDERRLLSNRNGTGQIEKVKDAIQDKINAINELNNSAAAIESIRERVDAIDLEIQKLTTTQGAIKQQIKEYGKVHEKMANQAMYQNLQEQLLTAQSDLAKKQKILNGQETNLTEIQAYMFVKDNNQRGRKVFNILALLLAVSILFAVVAFTFKQVIVGIILTIAVGVLFILCLICYLRLKRLSRVKVTNVENFLAKFNFDAQIHTNAEKLILLKQTLSEIPDLQARVNLCSEKLAMFMTEKNQAQEVTVTEVTDINELQNSEAALQSKIDKQRELKAAEIAKISKIQNELTALNDLENEKQNLKNKLLNLNEKYAAVKNAAKFLAEANDSLSTQFLQPMKNGLQKYLGLITEKNFDNLQLDTEFNLSFDEYGRSRHVDYYSKGYQNTFELCLRLALIDAIWGQEKPFIVLDDPFVNMDESKITNAKQFLQKLANECQIVYFSCHSSRC